MLEIYLYVILDTERSTTYLNISKQIEIELSKNSLPKYKQNRLKAIKYHIEGLKPYEISDKVGITTRSIQRIIKEYTENGMEEFLHKKTPGNVNPLSAGQIEDLIQDLQKSPEDFGFVFREWSTASLIVHVEHKYNTILSMEWSRLFLKKHLKSMLSVGSQLTPIKGSMREFKESCIKLSKSDVNIWVFGQFHIGLYPKEKSTKDAMKTKVQVLFASQLYQPRHIFLITTYHTDIRSQWTKLLQITLEKDSHKRILFFLPQSSHAKFAASRFRYEDSKLLCINFLFTDFNSKRFTEDAKEHVIHELNKYLRKNKMMDFKADVPHLTRDELKGLKKVERLSTK